MTEKQFRKLKEGDRVKLSKYGEEEYGSQADGFPGTIIKTYDDYYDSINIKWDNGHINAYRAKHLLLDKPLTTKQLNQINIKNLTT